MNAVVAPALRRTSAGLGRELAVAVAIALAVAVTFVLAPIAGMSGGAVRLESAARVAVVGIPVVVGLYAWRRVPFGRFGTVLVLTAVLWLVVTFSLGDRSVAYSVGRVAEWVGVVAVVYLMLAFPDGRLGARVDRALAAALGLDLVLLWLPTALLVDGYPTPSEWVTCSANCPHNAFMVVGHEPGGIASAVVPLRELVTVLLFLAVVARLIQRIAVASRVRRRTLTPVLGVAVAGVLILALGIVVRRLAPGSPLLSALRWVVALALPAMALAFLVGLVRWRLYVGASLSRFAASLGSRDGGPEGMRDAFAAAFEDPSLAIVYPVAEDRWAAADGRLVPAPSAYAGRAVTELHDDSHQVVAALIHDDALRDEAAFVNAVGSYAALSLENQRLAADVAHLGLEMREAQARATVSADRTRERIERDLHDGAQQRLIALRIKLQLAADDAANNPDGAERLKELGADVQLAINELRTLARGVFTPVLTDLGPVAALRQAGRDAPIPTTITAAKIRRFSPDVERAVYFCCLEALQNAFKHAQAATAVRVTIVDRGHELTFEVSDDGEGFDLYTVDAGAGLRNMRDRVASLGGSLTISARSGHGTRISGAIPVGTPLTSSDPRE
jgi:signal transduction histidine kinase